MLSNAKKKIMIRAIQIRLNRGEDLETILASYTKLTDEDKEALRKEFATEETAESSGGSTSSTESTGATEGASGSDV